MSGQTARKGSVAYRPDIDGLRAVAILPVVFEVMVFCALAGWWPIVSDYCRLLGRSLFPAILSVSNLLV